MSSRGFVLPACGIGHVAYSHANRLAGGAIIPFMGKDAPLKTQPETAAARPASPTVSPSAPDPWWLSWIRTYPVVILSGILSVIGGAYAVGEVVGALRAPTRVDAVDEEVDALRTQVETQIGVLRTQVETFDDYALSSEVSATTLSNEVDALRTQVVSATTLSSEVSATTLSNEVDALRTQVQALASYVEDLRIEAEPTAANNEVDALRTQVQALVAVASNEVDALRTQVETLVETPQTAQMADVVNLRFLVETLATRLVAVTASDEIEVLNTQVEMLREIMYCSIAQTENVRQHLETRTTLELTLILPRRRTPMVESCTELLGRLGVG